jgi:hypothetical protein
VPHKEKFSPGKPTNPRRDTMQVQPPRKPGAKITEVADELTQEELDKVSAGKIDRFLKMEDIKGESVDKGHTGQGRL